MVAAMGGGEYNTVRPHRAVGRKTPLEAFEACAKAYPTGPKIDVAGYRVRLATSHERRRWDLNPRTLAGHTISNRADSAALALLRQASGRYRCTYWRCRAQ